MSSTSVLPKSTVIDASPCALLPLQPGDHLTAEEFERRYHAMPGLKKAELIEGVVYMPSPVTIDGHASPHVDISTWLGTYRAFTPGVQAGDNATVRLGEASQPQPDLLLRILPGHGGATTTEDNYVAGPPEFIAEVSASSASYDLHSKLREYHRAGVPEYVVWRVWDGAIDWFVRMEADYQKFEASSGVYRSGVFPGLWLDADAMIAGDLARVLAVLQEGLATQEHAAFCEVLRNRSTNPNP